MLDGMAGNRGVQVGDDAGKWATSNAFRRSQDGARREVQRARFRGASWRRNHCRDCSQGFHDSEPASPRWVGKAPPTSACAGLKDAYIAPGANDHGGRQGLVVHLARSKPQQYGYAAGIGGRRQSLAQHVRRQRWRLGTSVARPANGNGATILTQQALRTDKVTYTWSACDSGFEAKMHEVLLVYQK